MAENEPKPTTEAEELAKEGPVEAAETIREIASDLEQTPAVEAFEAAKESLVEAIEKTAPPAPEQPEAALTPHVSDRTVLMGRVFPFPVYTTVFITLGVITVVELLLAEVFPRGFLTIPLMLLLSLSKAGLVVWFYMHLNTDSRVFAITLAIPVIMVTLATFFLLSVPVGY